MSRYHLHWQGDVLRLNQDLPDAESGLDVPLSVRESYAWSAGSVRCQTAKGNSRCALSRSSK